MIVKKIIADDNEFIKKVKFVDHDSFVVQSFLYPENVHRIRKYKHQEINEEIEFDQKIENEAIFIGKSKIRVFTQSEIRQIDFSAGETSIPIINPHQKLRDRRFSHYVHAVEIGQNEYLVTVQTPGSAGDHYARYFSVLKINEGKSVFFMPDPKTEAKWIQNISEPSYELFSSLYYNTGFHAKLPQDWLSIISVGCRDDKLFFYTNGGASTRTKSGPRYECSEIGIMDRDLSVVEVKKVHYGSGQFSSDMKYFVQQEYKKERNMHIYDLNSFNLTTLRTTPKTHLGNIRRHAKADIASNHLIMYDFKNVTISRVI